MNLQELINNIDIVLKPYDNRTDLNPRQQHAKDTLLGCRLMIEKLCQVVDEKDEHLKINYSAYTKQGIEVKKLQTEVMRLESEIQVLKQDNRDLEQQNEMFKKNLAI